MPDDDQVQASLEQHSHRVDDEVASFLASLGICIELAQHRLSAYLLRALKLEAGAIARTAANVRILRRLPQLWQKSLDEAGLEDVVTGFTDTFPQQVREFEHILSVVNQAAKEPLPIPAFTQSDLGYFKAIQQSSAVDIAATVEASGAALRTAPGISFKDLSQLIVDKTDAVRSRAETISNTSLFGYYRSVAAVGYERIEAKTGRPIVYDYVGPDDAKTRPRCEVWLHRSERRPFTREEIDNLEPDPGAPSPVLIYGAGFNCRHQFLVSLRQIPLNQ